MIPRYLPHLLAFVFSLLIPANSLAADDPPALLAGAATADITPRTWPLRIYSQIAEKARDPLHARALVLSDGQITLAMVAVDALSVGPETCDKIRSRVSEQCDLKAENIMISATHSHTTPFNGVKKGSPAQLDYVEVFLKGVSEAIVKAHANLKPASIGWSTHPVPSEVRNRRWFLKAGKMPPNPWGELDQVKMNPGYSDQVLDRPAGPTDPDVTILSVMDARGRKSRALYANYSLHYVGGLPKKQVSADYYGEFARLMPSRLRSEEDFVAIMSNGASGDINNLPFLVNRPPRERGEQIRIVATKTADAAWHAWKKIDAWQKNPRLGMVQRNITLQLRQPRAEQIERAKAILAISDKKEQGKLPAGAISYARNTMAMLEGGEITLPLQALRIGDFSAVAIPFETLVEIGLELKKRSPFGTTMVVGLGNGRYGYLPTPKQHQLGGYETWLGTCKVREDSSELIVKELLEMLAELKK